MPMRNSYRIIEKALNQLDRPQAQVAVEMTIAEVTLNNTLQYGVQFFLGSLNTLNSFSNGVQAINSPTGSAALANQPGFNFMIGSKLTPHVIISALNQYTTTKILANPSLVVIDNQVATLCRRPASAGHDRKRKYFELGLRSLQYRFQLRYIPKHGHYFACPAPRPCQWQC